MKGLPIITNLHQKEIYLNHEYVVKFKKKTPPFNYFDWNLLTVLIRKFFHETTTRTYGWLYARAFLSHDNDSK